MRMSFISFGSGGGRRSFPAVLLILGLFASLAAPAAYAQDRAEVADGIVAVVGDDIILRSEVDVLVRRLLAQQPQRSYSRELWMRTLDELVNQQVLVETAQADTTIKVTDEQVQQVLDRRFARVIEQAGGAEALEARYGKSVLQLKEQFKQDFRQQLLAERLRQRKVQQVQITPSEVRTWFEALPQDSLPRLPETVRLAHIVRYPAPSAQARAEARETITALRDSALAGVPIEELARRHSDDVRPAATGGRYSGFPLSDLEPAFAAVAARVPVGEISQVFKASRGFHFLRVNERTGNTVDFNHVLIEVDEDLMESDAAVTYLSAVRDSLLEYDVSFALMAKRHSEEVLTKDDGGRVTAPRTGMRELILEALGPSWRSTIDTLQVGEISKPAEVELLTGERAYHIVKLQERTPAHRMSLAADYARIRQYALREKQQRVIQAWLDQLREEVFVDVRVDAEDLMARR